MTKPKVKRLTCSCCGCSTFGRQWHNRDTGYGLCPKCAKWIKDRGESDESMLSSYGKPDYHYFTLDSLFIGCFPTGLSYADKNKSEHGDYKRIAFLFFDTLELKVYDHNSPHLSYVEEHAYSLRERRGEEYQTSTSGQTITLGYALK